MLGLAKFLSPKTSKGSINSFLSPFKSSKPDKKDENYNIDVLCMNCQGMINVNEIDKHSMTCCKISEKVFQIENNLNIDQIDYKLTKLREALETHIGQRHNFEDGRNEERNAREIIEFINQILYYERRSDLKKIKALKELLSTLQTKLDEFTGSTSLLLYLERVKLLGKEKYRELIKQDQESISNWKDHINYAGTNMAAGPNNRTPSTNSSYNSIRPGAMGPDPDYVNNISAQGIKPKRVQSPSPHIFQSGAPESYSSQNYSSMGQRQSPGTNPYSSVRPAQNYSLEREQNNNVMRGTGTKQSVDIFGTPQSNKRMDNGGFSRPTNNKAYAEDMGYPTNPDYYSSNKNLLPFDISKNRPPTDNMNYYSNASPSRGGEEGSPSFQRPGNPGNRPSYDSFNYGQRPSSNQLSNQSFQSNSRYMSNETSQDSIPRDSQGLKYQLENKLESTKKEYSQITQLVDTYKKKTEIIQNSINTNYYGSPNIKKSTVSSALGGKEPEVVDLNARSTPVMQQYRDVPKNMQARSPFQDSRPSHSNNQFIKLRHNMIEEIESDTEMRPYSSKYSETQETNSNIDRTVYRGNRAHEDIGFDDIDHNYELQAMQEASQEEQRLFYSKCLAIKLKFKAQDLAQMVPVSLIYKDAMQNKIPEREWDMFIERAFANPEKYVDVKKIQKKKKHGLKNNLAEIAKTK